MTGSITSVSRLQGKTVLVTGRTGRRHGIGAAMVPWCREEGARVVLADVKGERGQAVALQHGATCVLADVSDHAWPAVRGQVWGWARAGTRDHCTGPVQVRLCGQRVPELAFDIASHAEHPSAGVAWHRTLCWRALCGDAGDVLHASRSRLSMHTVVGGPRMFCLPDQVEIVFDLYRDHEFNVELLPALAALFYTGSEVVLKAHFKPQVPPDGWSILHNWKRVTSRCIKPLCQQRKLTSCVKAEC